jgi:hypothetical protein
MKQYVLDEPGARASTPAPSEAVPGRVRWRWPIVLAAVSAVALVVAYSLVEHQPAPASSRVDAAVVPAYVASTVLAPVQEPVAAALPAPPAPAPEPAPSRVAREGGRYVIDLHSVAIGPAVAMLSDATRTSVTGADVVGASPARLTTSFVADSPLEAWKGVFGNVASFAMTCGHSSCAVRFVSLVGAPSIASLASTPVQALQPTSTAPAGSPATDESGQPVPDN